MKLATASLLLIVASLGSLTGCSSLFKSSKAPPPDTTPGPAATGSARTAGGASGTHVTTKRGTDAGVQHDFDSMSADDAARRGAGVSAYRQPALVGLYGELVGNEPDASGPYDGSSNVAQVSFSSEGACFDPEVDRTGKWMVFASTMHRLTSDIYFKSISGKTVTQLTNDPSDDSMPSFSPDGKRISFASNRSGNWDIYIMSVDGGQPVQVTGEPEHELHPTWSPDGRRLAYSKLGAQSDRWEIWVVDAANPGVRHFLDYGLFPEWNPDPARSKILFQRARQRGSRYHSIWTVDYVSGDAMHPTEVVSAANAATINPSWSPDGGKIAFSTVIEPDSHSDIPPKQADIWVVNIDGTGRTNLTNGKFANFQPAWCTDGRVYFVSNRSDVDNIWAVSTDRAVAAMRDPTQSHTAQAEPPPAEHVHVEAPLVHTSPPVAAVPRSTIAHAEHPGDEHGPSPEN